MLGYTALFMSILSCPLSCNIMSLDLQYHVSRPAQFGITFLLMSSDMIGLGYLFSFELPCFNPCPGVLLTTGYNMLMT